MNHSEKIEISVVVPVFNEEENIPILIPQLVKVLNRIGLSYEMVFVDDGSLDRSQRILKEMVSQYLSLRIIRFKENRGLSMALVAGIREARGETIVTLDSDLQNDPEDIPRLLEHLDRYDMATGWRQTREDPWLKKLSSKILNITQEQHRCSWRL